MQELTSFFNQLGWAGTTVLSVNLLLLIFARQILKIFYPEPEKVKGFARKVITFRALNLLIMIAYGYYNLYRPEGEKGLGLKVIGVFAIVYLAYLIAHLVQYFIVRQYGREKEIRGKNVRVYC